MKKIKLLYLTPHLSTGGMPQFVLKRIEELSKYGDRVELFLVEYSNFSETYTVQRDEIINILDSDHFFTLGDTSDIRRKYELIDIIRDNEIDIVHSEEMLEGFESFNKIPIDLMNMIYSKYRTWRMVETCHNIWFNPSDSKKLKPEAYSLVSPYHMEKTFSSENSLKELHLYPYTDKSQIKKIGKSDALKYLNMDPSKINVLNVGLWTVGKNQKEGVDIARNIANSNPEIFFHFVGNLAPNFEDYWGDVIKDLPSNVKIWGERNDVDKFMMACDVMMFNSTWECNPLVLREAIGYGMKILARDLPQYSDMFKPYITPINGDIKEISNQLLDLIGSDIEYNVPSDNNFGDVMLEFYDKVMQLEISENNSISNDYRFSQHFVGQPYFELNGTSNNKFKVEFIDNGKIAYSTELPFNSWTKLNKGYYVKWETKVYENDMLIYDNVMDLKDKRVYISFGSRSLGDTLAWIPYADEFRKKHGCKLIVSTFLNSLFSDQYKDIEFVNPGDPVNNIYAQYNLGWYYNDKGDVDYDMNPNDFRKQPLQKTATDILGLDYTEIRPLLNLPSVNKKKKVGIGIHSTAQSKYWNNANGWQEVVDYLIGSGYEVMLYSKEGDGYMGNQHPKGINTFSGDGLQPLIDDLSECEFFIGLSSGLSWLAWSVNIPVILISGFTEKYCEPTTGTHRIINESVCHGCFNRSRLDAGDWNWCPDHKNTDRMFECTKHIGSDLVIAEINKIINCDQVTIVLSHANTTEKRRMLIDALKSIRTKIILSTNYPVDDEITGLCDFVEYDKENPLLLKDEFDKYGPRYFWHSTVNGELTIEYFDYDHGYAVYKLIQNGLREAARNGFGVSHVVNYDYLIDHNTIIENYEHLKNHDAVFYNYLEKQYSDDSYCTGFFSGKTSKLLPIFNYFNDKAMYYTYPISNPILEVITHRMVSENNLNIKNLIFEDLRNNSSVNLIEDSHKLTEENVSGYKKEKEKIIDEKETLDYSEFDWGARSKWYMDLVIQEIFKDRLYEKIFEVNEGDIVVDFGASLGPFIYSILHKNPKQCYAVEPLSGQIEILHRNIGRDNVKIIQGAITERKHLSIEWDTIIEDAPTLTFREFIEGNNIDRIDFLKCDCEGGEYDVFRQENMEFLKSIPKIVTEFHMREDENYNKARFKWFRDNILTQFNKFEVRSVDGVDIKWDLYNDHFLEWYNEVIIHIDNR